VAGNLSRKAIMYHSVFVYYNATNETVFVYYNATAVYSVAGSGTDDLARAFVLSVPLLMIIAIAYTGNRPRLVAMGVRASIAFGWCQFGPFW
jgi:hypothetical protein